MICHRGLLVLVGFLACSCPLWGGAFYSNLTVLDAAAQDLDQALVKGGWDGMVVDDPVRPRVHLVCERRLDDQDPAWGEALAMDLSARLHCRVLYTLVHDSDELLLSLAHEGQIVFRYDSWPDYFNGGKQNPVIADLQNGANGFSVEVTALRDVLTAPPSPSFVDADERLMNFTHLVGLPEYVAGAGFRYLQEDPTYLDQYHVMVRPFRPRRP